MSVSIFDKRSRILRFIQINGVYIFLTELRRRAAVQFRRLMLRRVLRCPTIYLGPNCHLRGLSYIQLGKNFSAAGELWMEAIHEHNGTFYNPSIIIGDDVAISRWSHIAAAHSVQIGNGVLIGSKVIIIDHNHGTYRGKGSDPTLAPYQRSLSSDLSVVVGDNVWIGDGVVIGPGSVIGEGSIIGANSFVTGFIPPFCIAVGSPARPTKTYDFTLQKWVPVK
jgi:lipopolysaccharide O-acetyltransferase